MRRVITLLAICGCALLVMSEVRIGHTTLLEEARTIWQSHWVQTTLKGMGDPLLERMRPKKRTPSPTKKAPPKKQVSPKSPSTVVTERGPEEDRDLPPAPIPPPREPLHLPA